MYSHRQTKDIRGSYGVRPVRSGCRLGPWSQKRINVFHLRVSVSFMIRVSNPYYNTNIACSLDARRRPTRFIVAPLKVPHHPSSLKPKLTVRLQATLIAKLPIPCIHCTKFALTLNGKYEVPVLT